MDDRPEPSALEATFRALLADHPEAVVVTGRADGLLVPPPASMELGDHRVALARSGLELIAPASAMAAVLAWEKAKAEGTAGAVLELVGGELADVSYFDLTADHGLYAMVMIPAHPGALPPEAPVVVPPPPRLARVVKDDSAHLVDADDAAVTMFGFAREKLLGRSSLEFIHPDDHAAAIAAWIEVLSSPGASHRVRVRHACADGSWRWVEIGNRNLLHEPGVAAVLCDVLDVSEEMAALAALREREELLTRMAEALPVAVVHFDARGHVRYANDRLYELVGMPVGTDVDRLVACVVDQRRFLAAVERVQAGEDVDIEAEFDRADGTGRRYGTVAFRSLTGADGEPSGGIACIADVTESMRLRHELEARATYDVLTGCANRATILGVLDQRLADRRRGVAAVFVDLDGFKAVNDELGHAAGDALLVAAADRLRDALRVGDVVGRLGGDEFLAVCSDVTDAGFAAHLGERLAASLNRPLEVHGHRVQLRASVGVGWIDPGAAGRDAEDLIARADAAMYESKRGGAGRPVVAAAGASALL